MKKISYFLTICSVLIGTDLSAQEEWKLAKDKQGIKVYTRKSPQSNLKDSKSRVLINTSIDEAERLLSDFERHKDWMAKVGESKIIEKVSNTEFYIYYIGKAPWPVSDRDIIAHYIIKKAIGKVRFEVKGMADYIPEKKDFVRVPHTESWWELASNDNGQVAVEYYTSSDPGGSIPQWLANTAAEDVPYDTLKKMRELLEEE